MKKLLIGVGLVMLAACGDETATTQTGQADDLSTEQASTAEETNKGDSPVAEEAALDVEEKVKELREWQSYELVLATLKQFEAEEKIDEELYILTSYIKEPAEIYTDFKSISFNNVAYEVYANPNEAYMNYGMEGWESLDTYQDYLLDKMPSRVKLLEMLLSASTYIERETVEGDSVRDQYELNPTELTTLYQNLDAFIVYGKLFDDIPQSEQEIVSATTLSDLQSGRFHLIYDANEQIIGYEVVLAFNESDPTNEEVIDVFAFSEEFSNINKTEIERPAGL